MSEQYFIYHKSGEAQVVREPEYSELLKSGDYFKTPLEAEAAKKADLKAIVTQEENKLSAKEAAKQAKLEAAKAKAEAEAKALAEQNQGTQ